MGKALFAQEAVLSDQTAGMRLANSTRSSTVRLTLGVEPEFESRQLGQGGRGSRSLNSAICANRICPGSVRAKSLVPYRQRSARGDVCVDWVVRAERCGYGDLQ
jgi:hypothetical protein